MSTGEYLPKVRMTGNYLEYEFTTDKDQASRLNDFDSQLVLKTAKDVARRAGKAGRDGARVRPVLSLINVLGTGDTKPHNSAELRFSQNAGHSNSCYFVRYSPFMKVLLADDSEDDRIALRLMIEECGHQVVEAKDGKQAVQATVDHNPDFVLMDLSMPMVDGLQASAAIRAISRFPGRVPIVAMTAFLETFTEDEAFKAGCDGYLQKPIRVDDLMKVFSKFVH